MVPSTLSLFAIVEADVASAQKRPISVDDIYSLKEVRDPQRSPDGKGVAYVVSHAIKDTGKNDSPRSRG